MVHGKFHCKLSACKQAVQNYMPVSDREEKMEDVVSIISTQESIMTDCEQFIKYEEVSSDKRWPIWPNYGISQQSWTESWSKF